MATFDTSDIFATEPSLYRTPNICVAEPRSWNYWICRFTSYTWNPQISHEMYNSEFKCLYQECLKNDLGGDTISRSLGTSTTKVVKDGLMERLQQLKDRGAKIDVRVQRVRKWLEGLHARKARIGEETQQVQNAVPLIS